MAHGLKTGLAVAATLLLAAAGALAEPHGGGGRPEMHPPEPHPGPSGYQRVGEPQGWNARPATIDRGVYQHNYQAARAYHIGVYHGPAGWQGHHWGYGMMLPRAYWTSQFILADYWLFALEVPPIGCEWVRVGPDAILVNTANGEVLQTEYGVFA
jgi:Ni/Co efflux regulator RcnB